MMVINADTYSQTIEREAVRLISHALFHCLGYKDKSSKEKDIMRRKEEDFIFSVSRETKQDV
jgi:ssRNA-specific RNase YbeY (16S rRNA maturation enzyme)